MQIPLKCRLNDSRCARFRNFFLQALLFPVKLITQDSLSTVTRSGTIFRCEMYSESNASVLTHQLDLITTSIFILKNESVCVQTQQFFYSFSVHDVFHFVTREYMIYNPFIVTMEEFWHLCQMADCDHVPFCYVWFLELFRRAMNIRCSS